MLKSTILAISIAGVGAACGGDGDKPKDAPNPNPDAAVLPRCAVPVSGTNIRFRSIGSIGSSAILATSPPADLRLFVVGQSGVIRIFKDEQLVATPFLDLRSSNGGPVIAGGEQGLLGLAFHPQYATNGLFFVFYTTNQPSSLRDVVARCSVSANPDIANPTCTEVLSIPDFASNHNGGMIEFGSDGFLYIGTGDGGGGGDPNKNGQSLVDGSPNAASVALLGKFLRIDVDNKAPGKEYGIPADNPFAGGGGAPEIFIIGVRNPWRWSFDRETGDMWIADVGQDQFEEVTVLTPAQQKGANLGWSIYEGTDCFTEPCNADTARGKTMPQHERPRATGWASITGGQVYRGTCYPDIVGQYFFADYVGGFYARATFDGTALTVTDLPAGLPSEPASLHADARGELYLTRTNGEVLRLEAAP